MFCIKGKMMGKLKSVKTWALLFCCGLLLFIVVRNRAEFISIAQILAWAPLSYFAANVAQDAIFARKGKGGEP